jgi:hypothetical protein
MAETVDFAATIASLQEQIDALNGELAGHRKLISTGDIDTFWLLFGGVLVFWMQAGFAMLEVGSVSKKNTKNILVKNIFDACAAASLFQRAGRAAETVVDCFFPRAPRCPPGPSRCPARPKYHRPPPGAVPPHARGLRPGRYFGARGAKCNRQ